MHLHVLTVINIKKYIYEIEVNGVKMQYYNLVIILIL